MEQCGAMYLCHVCIYFTFNKCNHFSNKLSLHITKGSAFTSREMQLEADVTTRRKKPEYQAFTSYYFTAVITNVAFSLIYIIFRCDSHTMALTERGLMKLII